MVCTVPSLQSNVLVALVIDTGKQHLQFCSIPYSQVVWQCPLQVWVRIVSFLAHWPRPWQTSTSTCTASESHLSSSLTSVQVLFACLLFLYSRIRSSSGWRTGLFNAPLLAPENAKRAKVAKERAMTAKDGLRFPLKVFMILINRYLRWSTSGAIRSLYSAKNLSGYVWIQEPPADYSIRQRPSPYTSTLLPNCPARVTLLHTKQTRTCVRTSTTEVLFQ